MHEIKGTTYSQKTDPWGPVLPTSSPQRAVVVPVWLQWGVEWGGEAGMQSSTLGGLGWQDKV